MKILVVHNRYQIRGGEDVVVEREVEMLRSFGVSVELLLVDNDGVQGMAAKLETAVNVIYSRSSRQLVSEKIRAFRPDVMHVHNTFPQLTPSVYDAAREQQVPVVQTLHNFRMTCANGLLFRDGKPCEDCVSKSVPWPGVLHGCYRGSRAGTAAVAAMIALHQHRQTWRRKVDIHIALTGFARSFYVRNGLLDSRQLRVKPNATADVGMGDGNGGYALYLGRLSPEKGVAQILECWRDDRGLPPLKIAGAGPLEDAVRKAERPGHVEWLGHQNREQAAAVMRHAAVLLLPSLCYEGMPMVVPEAYSAGLPVIASDIGSLPSLVQHGELGFLVRPGDAASLRSAVKELMQNDSLREKMRQNVRRKYEEIYQPAQNFLELKSIYEQAIQMRSTPGAAQRDADIVDVSPHQELSESH